MSFQSLPGSLSVSFSVSCIFFSLSSTLFLNDLKTPLSKYQFWCLFIFFTLTLTSPNLRCLRNNIYFGDVLPYIAKSRHLLSTPFKYFAKILTKSIFVYVSLSLSLTVSSLCIFLSFFQSLPHSLSQSLSLCIFFSLPLTLF